MFSHVQFGVRECLVKACPSLTPLRVILVSPRVRVATFALANRVNSLECPSLRHFHHFQLNTVLRGASFTRSGFCKTKRIVGILERTPAYARILSQPVLRWHSRVLEGAQGFSGHDGPSCGSMQINIVEQFPCTVLRERLPCDDCSVLRTALLGI